MQGILNKAVVNLVLWYRSNISPIKGYRCAHNTLHGNGSCSDWALSVTQEKGVLVMLLNLFARLYECNSASIALNKNNNNTEQKKDEGRECGKSEVAACCLNLTLWS
ncbi:MAG: membrane protein insertion efficiency factor YidD [Candidatus Thiodiazotropha sp. (ex Codakia orbicularis)]|nr:membrane protein insertion efficiency factor YidD [Candidatus Thiodiazotropha sp. (ex Codakia orbicularis)]